MKKGMGKMKIKGNGININTVEDLPICGGHNRYDDDTLYQNKDGQFYSHYIQCDKGHEVINEEIWIHTKEEAEEIMKNVGYDPEEIKLYREMNNNQALPS